MLRNEESPNELSPRAFFPVDKHVIGWPSASVVNSGLWTGDGQIVVCGRNGQLSAIKRGSPTKYWESLSAPAVSLATLADDGVAAALMDGTLCGLSKMVSILLIVHIYPIL